LLQQLSANKSKVLHLTFTAQASSGQDPQSTKASSGGEEEAKDLPPEEFIDFLNTLDNEVPTKEDGSFIPLDDALNIDFDINQCMIFLFNS
jgi:hypothetical protein